MIIKARHEDIETIYNFIQEGVKESKLLPRSVDEIKLLRDNFYVYKESKVIACIALDIYTSKIAEIRSLYVVPEKRNNGIGRKMISHCINEARERGIREIITVTDALSLFEKLDFRKELNGQSFLLLRI